MKKLAFIAVLTAIVFTASSQNIGIGVTNPTRAKFEVNGVAGNGATSAIFGGESTGISLQRNWPGIGFNQYYNNGGSRYIANGFAAVQYLDPTLGGIFTDVFTNGTTDALCSGQRRVMSIFQSGTIGLHGSGHTSLFNWGGNEDTYIRAGKNNGIVYINDIPGGKVALSGFVGINTATPAAPLEIREHSNMGLLIVEPSTWHHWELFTSQFSSGSLELYFDGALKGRFEGDGDYHSLSDKRLKTNITAMPNLLNKVMQLEPVAYEMKSQNPSSKKTIGFIAQDVKKLFPELVSVTSENPKDKSGIADLHTLNYKGFAIIAIKAIQEQQVLIESQKSEIDTLRKELEELKKSVNDLFAARK